MGNFMTQSLNATSTPLTIVVQNFHDFNYLITSDGCELLFYGQVQIDCHTFKKNNWIWERLNSYQLTSNLHQPSPSSWFLSWFQIYIFCHSLPSRTIIWNVFTSISSYKVLNCTNKSWVWLSLKWYYRLSYMFCPVWG